MFFPHCVYGQFFFFAGCVLNVQQHKDESIHAQKKCPLPISRISCIRAQKNELIFVVVRRNSANLKEFVQI